MSLRMLNPGRFIKDRFFRKHLPVTEVFGLFKEVLQSNNKALEVITDMGEKLDGEYLFDIVYIRQAYANLSKAIDNSIKRFDALTAGRYPRLHDAFDGVNGRVMTAINDVSPVPGLPVMFYEDLTWEMEREAGLKNLNLAGMRGLPGLNVPDAFAITATAFDSFMKYNSLDRKLMEISGAGDVADEALSELRGMIAGAGLPPELYSAISDAVEKIRSRHKGGCFLAVRSSAQDEDGEFSFAGQFQTVLNVPADPAAVAAAYKDVVASLFSPGAAGYQRRLGYDIGRLKMAVGCVAMVDAASSGVVHTSGPGPDWDKMLINAAWGLGSLVVEGRSGVDTFVAARPDTGGGPAILKRQVVTKDKMVVRLPGGGVEVAPTPEAVRDTPCLTDGQIRALVDAAGVIESHFRQPQEIEWAIDKTGKLYILQARPLKVAGGQDGAEGPPIPGDAVVLMGGKGTVVQKGTAPAGLISSGVRMTSPLTPNPAATFAKSTSGSPR